VCNPLAALHVRTQKKEKHNKKESLGVEKKEMRKQNTGRNEWLVLQLPATHVSTVFSVGQQVRLVLTVRLLHAAFFCLPPLPFS
jgi:hypothetical protein